MRRRSARARGECCVHLKVKWDANGSDGENLNGEWVRIRNTDALHPLNLAGWWFRNSALRRYRFPPGAFVVAGGSIRLRIGAGPDGGGVYHWGLNGPAFDNATNDLKQKGDGGYLFFDPHGNLRAHVQYPCRTTCREPLADKVQLETHYAAPEYVRVRNTSNTTISLFQYEIERAPSFYEFDRNSILFSGPEARPVCAGRARYGLRVHARLGGNRSRASPTKPAP